MFYYERTKYPEIFKDTYWGGFNDNNLFQETIDNRNKFVEEYKIIENLQAKRGRLYTKLYNSIRLDHLELYKTEDNKILMVQSIYKDYLRNLTKGEEKILESFKEIYQIYNLNTKTYIKEYIK